MTFSLKKTTCFLIYPSCIIYYRKYCGRHDPKFVYALQQLVQYSNEFIQDNSTVELAKVNYRYDNIFLRKSYKYI